MKDAQTALVLEPQPQAGLQQMTPLQMLQTAFEKAIEQGAAMEVIDRILKQQSAMIAYQDTVRFNDALARVQAKSRRVKANSENPQTHSKYANFAALDNVMRPLYIEEGLALSFNTADTDKPDTVRVVCDVSLGGYTRTYHIDMPADGKGAKGNDVMTKTHATGSAISYGKRYLLLMIFNLTVGEQDDDGNKAGGLTSLDLKEYAQLQESIENARTLGEVTATYLHALKVAGKIGDRTSIDAFEKAAMKRKGELK